MAGKIVVTGVGVVTPIGTGRAEFWKNLLAGRCGFAPVSSFDTSKFNVHCGAEIAGFRPQDFVRRQDPDELGRASQLAVAAAGMALQDADMDLAAIRPDRVGVFMGTTSGEPLLIERFDDCVVGHALDEVDGRFMNLYPCHVISAHIAREFQLAGPNMVIPTACAAGNYAIAHAYDALRCDRAEIMLAGGADAFSRITYTGFSRLGAIAPDMCRPFSMERAGMVPGEGAGVLCLETLEHARARGARIYAEIAGYGLSCDAFHMTGPHPEGAGAARAMESALQDSGVTGDEVAYISAHGTGTRVSDHVETLAIKRVFGNRAYEIPVSSIKSMLGHTMGAASAIEAATCSLAIHHGCIPPTANYGSEDPDCDLDYVPNEVRQCDIDVAMNNAYAFGGNNASLVLRKVGPSADAA